MKILHRLFALFLVTGAVAIATEVPKISPADAVKHIMSGKAVLVDVREPDEWAESGVAAPAILLPTSDFNGDQKLWKHFLKNNAGKEIILYCRSGNRSGKIAEKLAADGRTVANAGSFKDWAEAGLPVRQVEPKGSEPAR